MSLTINTFRDNGRNTEFSDICDFYCYTLSMNKIFESQINNHHAIISSFKTSSSPTPTRELENARQELGQCVNDYNFMERANRQQIQTKITEYAQKYQIDREGVSRAILASPSVQNIFKTLLSNPSLPTPPLTSNEPTAKKRKATVPLAESPSKSATT